MEARTSAGPGALQADVLLIAADWRTRALLRAQLIESGAAVVATDSWPAARQHMLVSGLPRAVVLDLHALDAAESVLRELGSVVPPASAVRQMLA
jgi:hypothetical protein